MMTTTSKIVGGVLVLVVLAASSLAVAISHNSPCGAAPSGATAPPMQAAVHRCYGAPDVVRIETLTRPVPSDHGVLIRVRATSVNPYDWHMMSGEPYPMRLGSGFGAPNDIALGTDFAGTVEAVGQRVTRFKPGDEVFGIGSGAFAQYLQIPEDATLVLKPSNLTFAQAAAVPVAGFTALQALRDHGQLRAGQKVLINGAGGGVGTFAVQIAKAMGADVTAVTNSGSLALVRSIGADRVIDYTHEDFTLRPDHYDLILDMSGNHSLSDYRRVMTPDGTYVIAGDTSKGSWAGPLAGFGKVLVVSKFVKQKLVPFIASLSQADLTILADMLQSGKIKPVIDRQYPFEQIGAAIRYQETGHARGKVVVTLD
jgi:NADPH:quinone reductase-like Zn-dependent oxidoreductase